MPINPGWDKEKRKDIRRRLIWRDGPYCSLCGGYMEPGDATIDHIIPKSVSRQPGLRHSLVNLRLAHESCNKARDVSLCREDLEAVAKNMRNRKHDEQRIQRRFDSWAATHEIGSAEDSAE